MTISAWRKTPERTGLQEGLVRLNLGCGLRKLGGFLNIDQCKDVEPDLVLELGAVPLPYADDSVAEVQGHDFLEHLPTAQALFHVLNECHRVLVADGLAVFRTPNFLSKSHPDWALGDPTHHRLFVPHTWDYFTAGHEQYEQNGRFYGIKPWHVVNLLMLDGDGTIQVTLQPAKE